MIVPNPHTRNSQSSRARDVLEICTTSFGDVAERPDFVRRLVFTTREIDPSPSRIPAV
jgi:hypothetical protein